MFAGENPIKTKREESVILHPSVEEWLPPVDRGDGNV
jgi:hypothetical protein